MCSAASRSAPAARSLVRGRTSVLGAAASPVESAAWFASTDDGQPDEGSFLLMRVALVHDYLTQRGGAERVLLSMLKAFPDAPLYTSIYEPDATYPEFADHDIRPMWINRFAALRAEHRRGLPLYPFAFRRVRFDPEPDVVLCSSSGFAHGVRTDACKVVYCYTPARWLYDKAPAYLAGWPLALRLACKAASPGLRAWDRRAAQSASQYLTSSPSVAEGVLHAYNRNAIVLPPPVHVDPSADQQPVDGLDPGFVLCVARLISYKNVEAVVASLRMVPGSTLVVVGEGPEHARLAALAPPNVTFIGRASEAELCWLYAHCVGLVSAAYEDFGLTPLEAAAFGKPVAVLRAGGFLDTVVEGTTGLYFDTPSPEFIAKALLSLVSSPWDEAAIVAHAADFGELGFIEKLRAAITAAHLRSCADDMIDVGQPYHQAPRNRLLRLPEDGV